MLTPVLETVRESILIQISLLFAGTVAVVFAVGQLGSLLLNLSIKYLATPEVKGFYSKVIEPRRRLLGSVIALVLLDGIVWLFFKLFLQVPWYRSVELPVTLVLTLTLGWLGSRLFKEYFDRYLLDAAARSGRKANSEFLVLAKFFANFAIVVILALTFGQTHDFNVIGLLASLGVGGLAVAFSAQKVLEQLLGGVVIYIDRPFSVDDYIGLPDSTYGRVESIGLRSTKIRTSGKGTLAIVPNNALIQSTIENFTGAKKVMAILYLNFYRRIPQDEQALIRQVILESTQDIFGLDARNTDIVFEENLELQRTQAQTTFFILGSGDVSMNIRRQLLDIANQNITRQLKEYGIAFDIEEPTIYVDSPITI
ncbi:mechanosensitive ion channel [Romeria aff. gracilis LEGE 07310]|uniref:Mechanosensitive ion channel n=1 Tax=Vasconcelosia minhoensis LEGE 07310 TaxID=915328 RepID=A0A8J7AL65_9CYAN|nr:mechanosensitive ion channel domain-containing protein [Romeria gracilis]MBE9079798.1 mechanosensitive ion channel [Romeria aff. gracilis LEGE 07310]